MQVVCSPATGSVPYPGINCNTAGAIQFAEHAFAGATGTFTVNWTAPTSASFGRVRFNLAGNAANGDFSSTGDFIYTTVATTDPAVTTDNSVKAFTLVNRGGKSFITDGTGAAPDVGYARIQPDAGQTTPAGVAIFASRDATNVITSEAGVPASPALTTGRIYAEVEIGGAVNTGLAIVNPGSSPASISFFYTDASGADLGSGSLPQPIVPNGHMARFLSEDPFRTFAGNTFRGTLTFTSNVPVAVIALRSYTNARGDFLWSTLPVIDMNAPPSTGTQFIPHFSAGGTWVTQILLVNTTDTTMTGNVQFLKDDGNAVNVTIGNQTASTFAYSVLRRSSQKLVTSGTELVGGSVRVVPTGGGAAPTPLVVFSYKPLGMVTSEAGVPAISGNNFRLYVESSGTFGPAGSIQSGIAISNNTTTTANVLLEATNLDGTTTGLPAPVPVDVPPSGHIGKFLSELITGLPAAFKGVIRISTSSSISVVGLRFHINERANEESLLTTTTPPTLENSAAPTVEYLFPQIAKGGGYTTQFILFSGFAGQTSAGNLKFFKTPDGAPFPLNLN